MNVILGKSPGETLRRVGHDAYGLEAQKNMCIKCFDRKFGKKKWNVKKWHVRDVSARLCKSWPHQLQAILEDTKKMGGTLAASHVCRFLRNANQAIAVKE